MDHTRTIDVAIAEDQPIYRAALIKIVEGQSGCRVIAAVSGCRELVEACAALHPKVLLLDVELADGDGLAVLEKVHACSPDTRVLVLTAFADEYTLVRAERAGVAGFLEKTEATTDQIRAAIWRIADGKLSYSEEFLRAKQARLTNPYAFTKLLSGREETVLGLCGLGLSNEEIGVQLGIAANTVRNHRHSVIEKLGFAGSGKLMAFAMRQGFVRFFADWRNRARRVRRSDGDNSTEW